MPKESDSDISSTEMILFVDPDEYDQRLANKKKGIIDNKPY